jgi:hypothetical protein
MTSPISVPAGFAPAYAVGYSDTGGRLALVSDTAPLPVSTAALAPDPLVGSISVSAIVGPFDAVAGRIVSVALGGEWEGTVTLLRSTDGGATKLPLRVAGEPWATFSSPGLEQAWQEAEEGASFFLDISLQSGNLAYRVSQ